MLLLRKLLMLYLWSAIVDVWIRVPSRPVGKMPNHFGRGSWGQMSSVRESLWDGHALASVRHRCRPSVVHNFKDLLL